MSDETAGRCRLSPAAAVAPLHSDDLLGEILLRLPPLPSSLPRVSAVSKLWGSIATSAAFQSRFRAHHRKLKPPILGVFRWYPRCIWFTSVLGPPNHIPAERFSLRICGDDSSDAWSMLGCRHGCLLVINQSRPEVLVFHPVSGDRRIVDVLPEFNVNHCKVHGAVFCSASEDQDNVHGDCRSSPFKVVLVSTRRDEDPAIARVYSSESCMWGDLVSTTETCGGFFDHLPSTLIGNALYWWLKAYESEVLLEFNLDRQSLAVIRRLPIPDISRDCMRIIRSEDGGAGIGVLAYPSFHMWDLKLDCHGVEAWVLRKTVNMQDIIGLPSSIDESMVDIAAYAKDTDEIFISGCGYGLLITVQLESRNIVDSQRVFRMIHSQTSLLLVLLERIVQLRPLIPLSHRTTETVWSNPPGSCDLRNSYNLVDAMRCFTLIKEPTLDSVGESRHFVNSPCITVSMWHLVTDLTVILQLQCL